MRIGVTGHQERPGIDWDWTDAAIPGKSQDRRETGCAIIVHQAVDARQEMRGLASEILFTSQPRALALSRRLADGREGLAEQLASELNKIVVALYGTCRSHMEEFAALDRTWPNYLNQVAQMLEALEQALSWSPRDRGILENVVHLTKDNIEGYKYWDSIHRVSGVHGITPEYEANLRALMDKAVGTLTEIDESYAPPAVEKKQADACFVVTATMGDFNHPDVVLLRRFRDQWILPRRGGRKAVEAYYRTGPSLADWIGRTNTRRRVSRALIVRPAVRIAISLLRR